MNLRVLCGQMQSNPTNLVLPTFVHCPLGFTWCPNQDCLAEQSRVWLTEAAQMLGPPNGSQGDSVICFLEGNRQVDCWFTELQSTVLWGDTVLLRPGQKVPGRCRPLQTDLLVDPFEDAELEALALSDLAVTWSALWHHFLFTVLGCQPSPATTANILHVLASVTNLCCVDKKGVLSWPNPKTEKVLFPQEQSTQPHNYQLGNEWEAPWTIPYIQRASLLGSRTEGDGRDDGVLLSDTFSATVYIHSSNVLWGSSWSGSVGKFAIEHYFGQLEWFHSLDVACPTETVVNNGGFDACY
ncbi:hypothetical protein Pcinc_021495 [Petrolisthes cinctipes]|uniref:Uncharacterized protein n=1 Tax=Petrolisthes cinctipes TaxID=88211 RepID=A0AAE1FHV6_PETCI|nr:hypothetical protein Pcinc_021495 [Petrolisthes cinctipes]